MRKYFLKSTILLSLLFLFNLSFKKGALANVQLVSPANGFNSPVNTVSFQWEKTDETQNYIYRYEYSSYPSFRIYDASLPMEEIYSHTRSFPIHRIMYWRIAYHPLSTFKKIFGYRSNMRVFAIDMDIPEEILQEVEEMNRVDSPTEEPEEEKKEKVEEKRHYEKRENTKLDENILQEIEEEVVVEQRKYFDSNIKDILSLERFTWNVNSNITSVLGAETSVDEEVLCKFDVLKGEYETIFCNIPKVEIIKQQQYPFANVFSVLIEGKQKRYFNIQIDNYICDFHLLKPSTWFKCNRKLESSNIFTVSPNIFFRITYDGFRQIPVRSFNPQDDSFTILAGYYRDQNTVLELIQTCRIVNREFNISHKEEKYYSLSPNLVNTDSDIKKPFSFPFSRIIGVTQWYGNTAYQTPHTGIDFGATKESVLAVEDGQVISKGWDSYFGQCYSGGNFLRIQQSNGMHTVYFHLSESYVNTGDFVKKGDVIARSGNSGAWNCQPLGYHLHFETRLNQDMNSHDNPVKYVDTDWNQVPTLNYTQYPGRLTGENPHPGR
ncbi:MAG: M23 family metallopeptidase [Candidatus Dojkabacteria bacterium]